MVGGIAIIQDVTRHRKIENALHQSRQELETRLREDTAAHEEVRQRLEQEINELKEAQEALQESEEKHKLSTRIGQAQELESLAVLAGGVAQSYDELLTDVLGQAGSVLEELSPDSSARYSVEQIEAAALRGTELTNQLLDYSGKSRRGDRTINLERLVDEMIHSLETILPPKAALKRQASVQTLMIKADAGQIRQSIMKLVTNASGALGDQEGVITLATGTMEADRVYLSKCYFAEELPEGPYVYLEVSDTGIGMDEETMAKIFVPFFTAKSSGHGLGLATVVGTLRAHHGAIRVKSTSEGGTTFRVLFPQLPGETGAED